MQNCWEKLIFVIDITCVYQYVAKYKILAVILLLQSDL